MARRLADAGKLMGDLLDRHEAGAASPVGYPAYLEFADVSAIDRFVRQLEEAEAAGAIRRAKGRGRNGDQIARVKLGVAARVYELLRRRPPGELQAGGGLSTDV